MIEALEPIAVALPLPEGEPIALPQLEPPPQLVFRKAWSAFDPDPRNPRRRRARALAGPAGPDRQLVPELVRPALIVENQQTPRQAVRGGIARDPREPVVGEVL